MVFKPRNPKDYTVLMLNENYQPVKSVKDIKSYGTKMILFFKGEPIGHGNLERERRRNNKNRGIVSTESVGLEDGYRNKGHGIILYMALISQAKKLGAKVLYSSLTLNKHSRRMWKEKLVKAGYKVVPVYNQTKCWKCETNHRCQQRFRIKL